jgi:hypothetical protein
MNLTRLGVIQSYRRPLLYGAGAFGGSSSPSDSYGDEILISDGYASGYKLLYEYGKDDGCVEVKLSRSYLQGVGSSFKGDGSTLYGCAFYLKKYGVPTGLLTASIYAHTGTYATNGRPTGTALAGGDTDLSFIYTTTSFIAVYFATPFTTVNGTNYVFALEYADGSSADYASVIIDDTNVFTYGNYSTESGTTWTGTTGKSICYQIFGTPVLVEAQFDNYDIANGDQYNYVAGSGENRRIAQSFTAVDGLLSKFAVWLRKTGSPTGNITAVLYAHTGTFGTTGTPTGTALATSDALSAASVATVDTEYTFTFSGVNQYSMTAGTNYWLSIEFSGGSTSNKIGVIMDISSPTAPGRAAYYNGTTWSFTTSGTGTSGASDDMCYTIFALS